MEELFREPSHQIKRIPFRPLPYISDFVVEKFPLLLQDVREGKMDAELFAEICTTVIQRLWDKNSHLHLSHDNFAKILLHPTIRGVALLDLKIMEMGIVHSGVMPSKLLTQLIDEFSYAAELPPMLTYEEIVLVNPSRDWRTFTFGSIGHTERDFYLAHARSEEHMEQAINALKESIRLLLFHDSKRHYQIKGLIDRTAVQLSELVGYIGKMRTTMSGEHFTIFRQYLNSHPIRGVVSPVFLQPGKMIPETHYTYSKENKMVGLKGPSATFT
ncbi:MAG: hypothetical protein G01um101433_854, partial [Parcubacteria group bacterium Gr01-1014_33]